MPVQVGAAPLTLIVSHLLMPTANSINNNNILPCHHAYQSRIVRPHMLFVLPPARVYVGVRGAQGWERCPELWSSLPALAPQNVLAGTSGLHSDGQEGTRSLGIAKLCWVLIAVLCSAVPGL